MYEHVLWDNLEGYGVVREVGSGGRGHMYTCGLLVLMYSKNHHNIVKKKKLTDGDLGLNTQSKLSHT